MQVVQTEKRLPMNEHPFGAFIELITLDQAIRTIHEEITQLKKETDEYLEQKKELVNRFGQFKQHVHDLRKMVDEKELEMKELDQQERTKKEQLEQITSTKLYQPIKKEIERLKQEQHEAEMHLMAIWNKLDVAQKDLQEQQTTYDSKIEEFHTQIGQKQDKIVSLQQQLTEKKQDRPAKESGIPKDWLDKYTHMRLRVTDPVVQVMRGSCSACFYTIPDQELIRLKRRALVQCKGCFRLLYMQEAMEESSSDTQEPSQQ